MCIYKIYIYIYIYVVNIGDFLRSPGLLSTASAAELKIAAWKIVRSAVCKCVENGKMLLLECIEEIDDAFSLMDVMNDFGLALTQVLLIPHHDIVLNVLRKDLEMHTELTAASMLRDTERKMNERQQNGTQTLRNSWSFFVFGSSLRSLGCSCRQLQPFYG